METVGAGWGEWTFGPCATLTHSPWPSWRGRLCERTGPSLYGGSHRIEQKDFSKEKKTLGGTLGNSPAAPAPVSSPPSHPPVWGVYPATGECAHPPETERFDLGVSTPHLGGNCDHRHQSGRMQSDHRCRVCGLNKECPHLISEGTETTGTGESANQGRLRTHSPSPEEAYHNKE